MGQNGDLYTMYAVFAAVLILIIEHYRKSHCYVVMVARMTVIRLCVHYAEDVLISFMNISNMRPKRKLKNYLES